MPKNKKLLKMLNETGVKALLQRTQLDAIADRKLPIRQQKMRDVEDNLYFVLDEKGHSVHLTERGAEMMSPNDPGLFIVPDISQAIHDVEKDTERTPEQRVEARRQIEAEYATKSEKLHSIHKLLQAHALYERDVDYLVVEGQVLIGGRVHRAAPCTGAGGPTACTRPSRPRRGCRSRARRRPSPPSPSRTTSGCTTSSRA